MCVSLYVCECVYIASSTICTQVLERTRFQIVSFSFRCTNRNVALVDWLVQRVSWLHDWLRQGHLVGSCESKNRSWCFRLAYFTSSSFTVTWSWRNLNDSLSLSLLKPPSYFSSFFLRVPCRPTGGPWWQCQLSGKLPSFRCHSLCPCIVFDWSLVCDVTSIRKAISLHSQVRNCEKRRMKSNTV